VANFDVQLTNVIGDVMVSAGVVAYQGAFTVSVYISYWRSICTYFLFAFCPILGRVQSYTTQAVVTISY